MLSKNANFIFKGVFSLFVLLAGCHSVPKQEDPEVIRSAQIIKLSQTLQASGARVIQTGQTLKIILPSDRLFAPHSANFVRASSAMLNTVYRMMAILETTSAQVAGYSDAEPDALRNKALSIRQAELVADYLWAKGLDARLLYAVGYGSQGGASAGPPKSLGENANYRIEISFQYLPLLTSLTQ